MVNAHLSQTQNSSYVHAIFKTDEGIRVSSADFQNPTTAYKEAQRQMYFLNRNIMAKLLIGFLLQRKVALRKSDIAEIPVALYNVIYANRMLDFHAFIKIVEFNYPSFLKIIPDQKSRWYNNYKKNIEPILQFCVEKETKGE